MLPDNSKSELAAKMLHVARCLQYYDGFCVINYDAVTQHGKKKKRQIKARETEIRWLIAK